MSGKFNQASIIIGSIWATSLLIKNISLCSIMEPHISNDCFINSVGLLNFFNEDLLHRKGGQMDPYLDLDKIFDPSNGGMIEMVQLPDIFLDHPTVSVTVCC